jgi:hypothetical protein
LGRLDDRKKENAMKNCPLQIAALVVLSVLNLPAAARAADAAKLSVEKSKPPAELAEPIRSVLDDKAVRLASGEKPFFEFWFRKELPLAEKPAGGTIGLTTVKEGTVLGAVRVTGQRFDFRNEEIPPGVYVVRYGVQPEDGNHLGVAPTRTFALLIPAKIDKTLEPVPHEALMKEAAKINAAMHPTNLNLQPVDKAEGAFPRLEERNGGDHKVVLLKLPSLVAASKEKTPLVFALVYGGTGQI